MKDKARPKMTYEIILSNQNSDYALKLNSFPVDYKNINLDELIKMAKNQGLRVIQCVRIKFSEKEINYLKSLGVYPDLEIGHKFFYDLYLNKDDYDDSLKRKNEHPIEGSNRFIMVGII